MMSRFAAIKLAVILSLFCTSCGEYEVLEYQKVMQRKADSTYKAEVKNLKVFADSFCNSNYERYYQAALDSLIPARIDEMKKLVEK